LNADNILLYLRVSSNADVDFAGNVSDISVKTIHEKEELF
jgi:hypothetical protein